MASTATPPRFDGFCPLCGWCGVFNLAKTDGQIARDFLCGGCRNSLVFQAEAAAIIDEFGRGDALCLDELVKTPRFSATTIYHVGKSGPLRQRLKALPGFQESVYRDDVPLGRSLGNGPVCTNQDHQRLTFPGSSFDLMVSSHVLEHIPDPGLAFREAHRVLRPGGRYIFSVPGKRPPAGSTRRAAFVDGELVHLLEPQYHNSPEGKPALVFTDFGRDLLDLLEDVGFVATLRRTHRALQGAQLNYVIVAQKP